MIAKLRAPGWYRAGLFMLFGVAFAYLLVGVVRSAMHYPDAWDDGDAITIVSLLGTPLFFLVGLGCFDYWFYWVSGRPTRPEDHS
ncbi:MAG TPA: cytochrome c oxidase subunit I, partial [Conexibacter sp.]|nr:cytochrome c oxidase subunit I [Conexibacter sp.]